MLSNTSFKILPCNLTRRCFSKSASEVDNFNFSGYRYFIPAQSRWSDNDKHGHINNSIYVAWSGVLLRTCSIRMFNNVGLKMFSANVAVTHRKPVAFPEIPLGGVNVTKIGNSSVMFNYAFFKPKSALIDPVDFGLTLGGKFPHEIDMTDITSRYENDAAALVKALTVFVDDSNKPVRELPKLLKAALKDLQF